jgi:hypothetical protein
MRQKGDPAIRATYVENTGIWEGKVIRKVGSCSLNYRAYTTPANVGLVELYAFGAIVGINGGGNGDYGPECGMLPSYTGGKWMIDVYVSFAIHFCKMAKNQTPSFFSLVSLINLMTP